MTSPLSKSSCASAGKQARRVPFSEALALPEAFISGKTPVGAPFTAVAAREGVTDPLGFVLEDGGILDGPVEDDAVVPGPTVGEREAAGGIVDISTLQAAPLIDTSEGKGSSPAPSLMIATNPNTVPVLVLISIIRPSSIVTIQFQNCLQSIVTLPLLHVHEIVTSSPLPPTTALTENPVDQAELTVYCKSAQVSIKVEGKGEGVTDADPADEEGTGLEDDMPGAGVGGVPDANTLGCSRPSGSNPWTRTPPS
mmetsp:Transcript_11991/g.24404  ORF Transcript_11991/g.24404 Transcript_11991/m.24404 type:complete len:253 (+) Transcript_11991:701-1459(+)